MKTVGNIIWLIFAGIWLFIAYVVAGIVSCIFIITIPFGVQSFKLASFVIWRVGTRLGLRQHPLVRAGRLVSRADAFPDGFGALHLRHHDPARDSGLQTRRPRAGALR